MADAIFDDDDDDGFAGEGQDFEEWDEELRPIRSGRCGSEMD